MGDDLSPLAAREGPRLTRRRASLAIAVVLAVWASFSPGALAAELEDLLFDLQLIPLGGQNPPPFTLESLDGKKLSLSDFRGKPVFLYFWASW